MKFLHVHYTPMFIFNEGMRTCNLLQGSFGFIKSCTHNIYCSFLGNPKLCMEKYMINVNFLTMYSPLCNTRDIHTYARLILFKPNPNPNPRNLRKENPNPNPRNPRRELKSFVKPQEDIESYFERWQMVFLKLELKN